MRFLNVITIIGLLVITAHLIPHSFSHVSQPIELKQPR
jgi:hypothetical protein